MSDSLYLHSPVVMGRYRSCPAHHNHNDSSHSSIESMTSPKNDAGLILFGSIEKKHELNKERKSRGSLDDIHENETHAVNDIGRDEDNIIRDNTTCVRSPIAMDRYRSCPVGSKPNVSGKSQLLLPLKSAADLKEIMTHDPPVDMSRRCSGPDRRNDSRHTSIKPVSQPESAGGLIFPESVDEKCGSRDILHSQNLHIDANGSQDHKQYSSKEEDDSTREDSTACLRSPITLGGHQRNRSCPAQFISRSGSDISSKFHLPSKSFTGLLSSVVKTRNRGWKKNISKAQAVLHEKEEDLVSESMTPVKKKVSLPGVKTVATVVEDEDNAPDVVSSDTDSVIKPPMQVNEKYQGTELSQSISDITDDSTPSASSSDDSSNDSTYYNSSSESCSLSTQHESILTEYSSVLSMSTREEGRRNEERMIDSDALYPYSSSGTSAFTGESKGWVSDSSKAFSVLTNFFRFK